MNVKTEIDIDIEDMCKEITEKASPYSLILYNDDHHEFMEVVLVVVAATKRKAEDALKIVEKAHQYGSATALRGTKEECEKADEVFKAASLKTKIVKG